MTLLFLFSLLSLLCLFPNSSYSWTIMSTNDSQSFPLSTRQALINKAKSLSPSSSSQQYSSVGWSNRVGSALTPAAIPGVYTADRPFLWNNIDVGCRMTVIELESNGGLWIHSPVGLDGPLRHALEQLNQPVKHVVSPNYEHVKFASQWHRAFPDAKMWGCPGLMERLPEISWAGEIPNHCRPPTWTTNAQVTTCSNKEFWDWNEIQPLHIDIEVNPFTNKPFFNEVVYYHTPSKTLMTTDFYWNYPKADGIPNSNYRGYPNDNQDFGEWELAPQVDKIPIGSRLWKVGMDKVFYPFYMNFMVKSDQQATFQDICTFLIHTWEIDTVIPAHGDIVRGRDLINSIFKDFFKIKK